MTYWNYRLFHRPLGELDEYTIRVAYYEGDEVVAWSAEAVRLCADTRDDLVADAGAMMKACDLPVVELSDDGESLVGESARLGGPQPI